MAEENSWAVTRATERLCCGRSSSVVLEFGFQLEYLVFMHSICQLIVRVVSCNLRNIPLASDFLKCKHCVGRGGCVYSFFFTGESLGAVAKWRKATISFVMTVRLSVRPSAWNNLAPTERIFMEFYYLSFFLTLSRKFKFH